jgi:hypothetical protein
MESRRSSGTPHKAVSYCFGEAEIPLEQVEHIGFYIKPWPAITKRVSVRLAKA